MLNIWKTPMNKTLQLSLKKKVVMGNVQKFRFSAGGGHGQGHSGSESDHDHDHHEHDDHHDAHAEHSHDVPLVSEGNFAQEARSRIFNRQETFSVESLMSSLKQPLVQRTPQLDSSSVEVYKSKEEYVNFLAANFERRALEKYPQYKQSLDQFKHLIPNYDSLNAYQREVLTLDTYLHWQLELQELGNRNSYNFSGSPVDRARERFAFFQKLITEDHHHDTAVMHHLREKLRDVLQKELEFEEFKHTYNTTVENQIVEILVENRKKNFYFDIVKNKVDLERHISDLNAPGNKHKSDVSVTPHDHIHPQHFHRNPEKINQERWNYLAYFDIIIDQHLRQVRPSSISEKDEMFKYVKDENRPLKVVENFMNDNFYHEYLFTLENEFYVKFKEELGRTLDKLNIPLDVEDKVRK